MKKILVFFIFLLPVLIQAQTFEREISSIPVSKDGVLLSIPFNGGFNTLGITMTDIDYDGDPDLFLTGRDDGSLLFFRNEGNAAAGEFTLADAAVSGLEFGPWDNRLAFEDIDSDGDLDLFVGSNGGQLKYFQNNGDPVTPDYELVTNLFESIDVGYLSAPSFYDLNDDGLNDLVIGSYREGLFYFTRDDSTTTTFTFVDTLRDGSSEIIKPGFQFYTPVLVDIDNDDDGDLFVGSSDSQLAFYRNTGSAASPQFNLENMEYIVPPGYMSFLTPAFADVDNDSDFDLFFGSNDGFVTYYENEGNAGNPVFTLATEELTLDYLDFGFYSSPTLVDINADGDKDLFVSSDQGELHFFENTGNPVSPEFTWITDYFGGFYGGNALNHSWGDLDNDSDFDLVLRNSSGYLFYYENSGTAEEPVIDSMGFLTDTLGALIYGNAPELTDLDGDNDLDLFLIVNAPESYRAILPVWNHGSADSVIFVVSEDTLRDDMGAIIKYYFPYFRFSDFDYDNDMDLYIGASNGNLVYYENTGTPNTPVFQFITDSFAGIAGGNNQSNLPFLADIDGDDDLDIFTGRYMGGLFFYRNTSQPSQPDLIDIITGEAELRQNYPNPFNTNTSIEYSLPVDSYIELAIFDLTGKKLFELEKGYKNTGVHYVEFNGSILPAGVYYYRLEANGMVQTRKISVLH